MNESPYRERPAMLLCPRCGDVLEEMFAGVSTCLTCDGLWIAQPAIDSTFGKRRWPDGSNAWWKRELDCPVCGSEGKDTVMDPVIAGDTIVDRCLGHGVWLDEGELGRLLGNHDSNEVVELYRRISPEGLPPERLLLRRDVLVAKRAQELAARQQGTHDREQIAEDLDAIRAREEERLAAFRRVAAENEERRAKLLEELQAQRKTTQQQLAAAEQRLVEARKRLEDAESELAVARLAARRVDDEITELNR